MMSGFLKPSRSSGWRFMRQAQHYFSAFHYLQIKTKPATLLAINNLPQPLNRCRWPAGSGLIMSIMVNLIRILGRKRGLGGLRPDLPAKGSKRDSLSAFPSRVASPARLVSPHRASLPPLALLFAVDFNPLKMQEIPLLQGLAKFLNSGLPLTPRLPDLI